MFKFNNTHIFTGYLKQLLSSTNIPNCRVYTEEFSNYLSEHGKEDPRVIESLDISSYLPSDGTLKKQRIAASVKYLIAHEFYKYHWCCGNSANGLNTTNISWKKACNAFFSPESNIPGLTRTLHSSGNVYDATTHEYLGDYLRFIRDYYNINLMSLYNCFSNKIYNNVYYRHGIEKETPIKDETGDRIETTTDYISTFDSRDAGYYIYALPVRLFQDYTVAVDCDSGIEMFCGLYSDTLELTAKGTDLINKTYKKINKTIFDQPFLYDALNVKYWNFETDTSLVPIGKSNAKYPKFMSDSDITRWDIVNREHDLKLFIKVPVSCKSTITILEGDFRSFNDAIYKPVNTAQWKYCCNHCVPNFDRQCKMPDMDKVAFKPISKLQLLAFNTGESYPFADRLVEYLSNSAITPIDEIKDNIKRVQRVMSKNGHYFRIEGAWENKMQKIIYDYIINSGPIETKKETDTKSGKPTYSIKDTRTGYHRTLGHNSKSSLYDILGYVDKDAEKWYASWGVAENGKPVAKDTIQNIDIYDGIYDKL